MEEFNTLNSSKLLWGFGKFVNKHIAPGYAQQISSSIMNRTEFAKTPTVNHRLHRKIVSQIFSRNKVITPDNFAVSLYSCASVGFYDKEFFDNAIGQFEQSEKLPSLKNLGYLVQSMALLRKSDHTPKLMEWVGRLTKEQPHLFLQPSKDLSDSEFSFAQILQGLAFLSPSRDLINKNLKPFLDFYYH